MTTPHNDVTVVSKTCFYAENNKLEIAADVSTIISATSEMKKNMRIFM